MRFTGNAINCATSGSSSRDPEGTYSEGTYSEGTYSGNLP